ncbi:MAG: YCF48-related protein [Candidatus Krumholzibacteriales bacterium]
MNKSFQTENSRSRLRSHLAKTLFICTCLLSLSAGCTEDICFDEPEWEEWKEIDLPDVPYYEVFTTAAEMPNGRLMVGSVGRVYRQVRGNSWEECKINDRGYGITRIVVDQDGAVFAAQSPGGVFISEDNGGSWEQVNNRLPNIYVNDLLATSGGELIAGTTGGLFISTDKGQNWSQYGEQAITAEVTSLEEVSGGALYAGTSSGIFMTGNSSQSWVIIDGELADTEITDMAVSPEGALYAVGGGKNVLRCKAGEQTAEDVSPSQSIHEITAIAVSGEGIVCIADFYNGVLISDNGGGTWTRSTYGLYYCSIRSMCAIGNEFIACSKNMLRSADGGMSWSLFDWDIWQEGVPATKWRGVTIACDGSILAGNRERGLFCGDEEGNTWIQVWDRFSAEEFAFGGGRAGSIYGNYVRIFDITSKVIVSNKLPEPENYIDTDFIEIDSRGRIYTGGRQDGIYRSEDMGETWGRLNLNFDDMEFDSYQFSVRVKNDNIIFVFSRECLLRSMDDGMTWKKIDIPGYYADLSPEGTIYLCGDDEILASTDNGGSWEIRKDGFYSVYSGYDPTRVKFAFSGTGHILMSCLGRIFYSRDRGRNWYRDYSAEVFAERSWLNDLTFGPGGHAYIIGDDYLIRSSEPVF